MRMITIYKVGNGRLQSRVSGKRNENEGLFGIVIVNKTLKMLRATAQFFTKLIFKSLEYSKDLVYERFRERQRDNEK